MNKIDKYSLQNNIYHVSVWLDDEKSYSKILLYIVKKGESYKIDNVDSMISLIGNHEKKQDAIH